MKLSSVEAAVMEALEQVIDPELGIDIVNLGLIYGVEVNTGKCQIKMTLTTQGCPLSDILSSTPHITFGGAVMPYLSIIGKRVFSFRV